MTIDKGTVLLTTFKMSVEPSLLSSFIRPDPDFLLLRGADQFIPEIGVRDADKHLRTLPGSASGQIDSAEFGYNKIALASGICHDFPVKVRQDPGTDRAVFFFVGRSHADESFSAAAHCRSGQSG